MSRIRGKNTKPELIVRKGLHAMGFRFRLHDKKLHGKPDLVFPKYNAVILVHGCFWHGHDCHLFKWPSSNTDFWHNKIIGNIEKDEANRAMLFEDGWRILIVWECSLKGKICLPVEQVIERASSWLGSQTPFEEIKGVCRESGRPDQDFV